VAAVPLLVLVINDVSTREALATMIKDTVSRSAALHINASRVRDQNVAGNIIGQDIATKPMHSNIVQE
jgi:hypothetical protein